MLSRIGFGINSISKSSSSSIKINNHILYSSLNKISNNKLINKNQFSQIINQYNYHHNNNNNVFKINQRFYSTSNNNKDNNELPPSTKNSRLKSFVTFLNSVSLSRDKGNQSLSNMFLLLFGLTCVYLSLSTLLIYLYDKDKPANDANLFTIMSYFNLYPPYRIFDKEGYIKRIIDSFKRGESSKEGRRIIEMMIIEPSLDGVNYLEKYGFYQDLYDKILAKKGQIQRGDPDYYMVTLVVFSGRVVPAEVLNKIDGLNVKNNQVLTYISKFRQTTNLKWSDVLIATLVAAPIGAYYTFRYRIPPVYLIKSMKRSAFVTGTLLSAPLLNEMVQRNSLNNSLSTHIVKTRAATIGYGAFLVYLARLPFITVFAPIFGTLLITKTFSSIKVLSDYSSFLKENKLSFNTDDGSFTTHENHFQKNNNDK